MKEITAEIKANEGWISTETGFPEWNDGWQNIITKDGLYTTGIFNELAGWWKIKTIFGGIDRIDPEEVTHYRSIKRKGGSHE